MESAIPKHLQCPRSRARRIAADYEPPFPSTVARFRPAIKQVVMAYFGVQYRGATPSFSAERALREIADSLGSEHGPSHWDRARYVDEAGFSNTISVGYWDSPAQFDAWLVPIGARWTEGALFGSEIGTFIEVLMPTVERFETGFSSDVPEGVGCLADGFSGMVQEHAYWGSARDRIALSQPQDLAPTGNPRVENNGLHRRVIGHENL